MAGLAVGASAFADVQQSMTSPRLADQLQGQQISLLKQAACVNAKKNEGTVVNGPKKAPEAQVAWKRPAGQFWGTGYSPGNGWYYFTPLVIRPWVDYTFENNSIGVSGTPSWSLEVLQNPQTGEYATETAEGESVTMSYIRYDGCAAPRISYKNMVPYPTMFEGESEAPEQFKDITVLPNNDIESYLGAPMPVSSHYWGAFSREAYEGSMGLTYYSGAEPYEGMENGFWFGTNAMGYNAMATRFEKPESPYLLNKVYWYGFSSGPIAKKVPLTAYVFKTVDPNVDQSFTTSSGREVYSEGVELGELIAVAQADILATRDSWEGVVEFQFKEVNPVTGAETIVSLEIEDDITIVVTGYDVNLGNGTYISSALSLDNIDEGYGNLGFLGRVEEGEDGSISYGLTALEYFFDGAPIGNTTLGVLADVSYPWLANYYVEQPSDIDLPNEGETTETEQGLEYTLFLMSTSMTEDFDVTFNGQDECDWLAITDVYDDMEDDEFTGITGLLFEAAPNPNDESRTCVVRISIPAASYEITFRQGSDNAVEIVGADGAAQYFDLQGRRVANPEKGLFIKKSGNKAEKVIL